MCHEHPVTPERLPYALPEKWLELSADLRKRLTPSDLESHSGTVQRVVTSDPKSLAIFVVSSGEIEAFSWKEFGRQFANGIVSGIAGWTVGYMLDYLKSAETIQLHDNAIRAIRDVFQEVIESAFLNHYMGEATGIRERLLTYRDTYDVSQLNSALDKGYDLVPRFYGLSIKGLGGFVMAANLHLAALRAKSEIDGSYRSTFDRLRQEYAGMGIGLANAARARLEERVGQCRCRTSRYRGEPPATVCEFTYDWGRGTRHFGANEDDPAGLCRNARANYYRGGTVEPIQYEINPLVDIINTWL